MKYNEIHFFIDESGNISNANRSDVLLVGGILLLGPYSDKLNNSVLNKLKSCMDKAGGKFPNDLHFHQQPTTSSETRTHHKQILEDFIPLAANAIDKLFDNDNELWGVCVEHQADIPSSPEEFLAEQEYDIRYRRMLWSLVEYFTYVDPEIRDKLSPESEIFLHVANRIFVLNDPDDHDIAHLEATGYSVEARRNQLQVTRTLEPRELTTMFQMAQRQRWKDTYPVLALVSIESIVYFGSKDRSKLSEGLMYYADLFLGEQRSAIQKQKPNAVIRTVNISKIVPYCGGLDTIANMQSALNRKALDEYLNYAADLQILPPDRARQSLDLSLENQASIAKHLVQQQPVALINLIEKANVLIDSPGFLDRGERLVKFAKDLIPSDHTDLSLDMLLIKAEFSNHNHRGETEKAEDTWRKFLEIEPRLPELPDGVELKAAIRNRRAVNLTDKFLHLEAVDVLQEIVSLQIGFYETLAALHGISIEELPKQQLGECLGTLGQAYAQIHGHEYQQLAVSCFQDAVQIFTDSDSTRRQCIYLGHVACDGGENSLDLWREVCDALPELNASNPICSDGEQYTLALQLKGAFVFGDSQQIAHLADNLRDGAIERHYAQTDCDNHPFGLIYQCIGEIFSAQWQASNDTTWLTDATSSFSKSQKIMSRGGPLLKLLSYFPALRSAIHCLTATPSDDAVKDNLRQTLLLLKAHSIEYFGAPLWHEDSAGKQSGYLGQFALDPTIASLKEQAESLLTAFRFNFW